MNIEEMAKTILGAVDKSGADEGEVYLKKTAGLEFNVRDQAVETLRNNETFGFGLRLIVEGRMALVHSSDVREASIEETVRKGLDLARAAAPDESNVLAEPSAAEVGAEIFDPMIETVGLERKVALLKDLETLAFAYDPAIARMETVSYSDEAADVVVANTRGLFKHGRWTRFEVELSVLAERNGEVESGRDGCQSRFFERLEPSSKMVSRACQRAVSMLGAKTLPTQTVPVIFDCDPIFAVLVHTFAMLNGENIATGVSALKGRLGETIASPLVTLVDDATLERGAASRPFDDEGVASRRTVVVDKGVLKSFLFNVKSGRKAGFASTGNAQRDNFRTLPGVGTTNFYLEKGGVAPEDIIRSTERGFHCTSLAGWWVGISPSTGDFSSGAKGFWIEGGEVAYPVRNVTVASNVVDMLKGVDAVGNDLRFKYPTVGPTIRVRGMTVGGV